MRLDLAALTGLFFLWFSACSGGAFNSKRSGDDAAVPQEAGAAGGAPSGGAGNAMSGGGSSGRAPSGGGSSGHTPSGGGSAGRPPVDSGTSPDASTSGGADARPPGAGGGSTVAPEASAPDASRRWCEGSTATFCADFDGVATLIEGWSASSVSTGAKLDYNLEQFVSPERGLRSRVPAGTGPDSASASLSKTIAFAGTQVSLDFDVEVKSVGTRPDANDSYLQLARLGRNADHGDGVGIYIENGGPWVVIVAAGTAIVAYDLPEPPPTGKFVRVSFDIIWAENVGSVHLALDGITVLSKTDVLTLGPDPTTTMTMALGLVDAVGKTPEAEAAYDNVTLRLK